MAKIGTAHVEIKPVLNEEALAEIAERIEAAVKAGVEAGMKAARAPVYTSINTTWTSKARTASCSCRPENGGSGVCGCILGGPEVTC